jgi:hypothetical protein
MENKSVNPATTWIRGLLGSKNHSAAFYVDRCSIPSGDCSLSTAERRMALLALCIQMQADLLRWPKYTKVRIAPAINESRSLPVWNSFYVRVCGK